MLAEGVLICAMALPAVGHHIGNPLINEEVSFAHMLGAFGPVLIVGCDPLRVTLFRKMGVQAFGAMTKDIKPDQWSVIADPDHLPFQSKTFQSVHFEHPNPLHQENGFEWCREVVKLVEPEGYLFFDESVYPSWKVWLLGWGWQRLPFVLGHYSVWQKHNFENFLRRNPGPEHFKLLRKVMACA